MFGRPVDKRGLNEPAIVHANMRRAYLRAFGIVGWPEIAVTTFGAWYGLQNGFPQAWLVVIVLIGVTVMAISVWGIAQSGSNYGAEVGPGGVTVYERLISRKRVAMRQIPWGELGPPELVGRGSLDIMFTCRDPPVFVSPEQAARILLDPRYPLRGSIPGPVIDRVRRYQTM